MHIDDDIISWGDRMSYLSDMKFNVVKREATDAARIEAVSYTHLGCPPQYSSQS